ncbi:unnamed protein product [Caenorhabditis angaria]|uniref:DOMON domain-containing protein n=1 Tax=Caenorhabditis angaria TaxID=860376 RepID=A0A9P1IDG7_9PELO|nr:unnamed protein product [Caenorhabditis angaria]
MSTSLIITLLSFCLISSTISRVTHIEECGISRGCWRLPLGCKTSEDCSTMITWKHERRHLIVEIESKLVKAGQWIGFGFSKDDQMGNDTVFECQFAESGGAGNVVLSHNTAKNNVVLQKASEMLIRDGYADIENGKAMCGGEMILDNIHLDLVERKLMHVISSGQYNLFFAFGNIDSKGEKHMHGMVGKEAPWRSKEQVRFCQRCSSSFANVDTNGIIDFKH